METCDSELSQLTKSLIKKLSLEIKLNNSRINSHNYVCSIVDIMLSSDINEVITAVLNSFFFLRKDFARTKSTESTKSTKRHKDTQAKAQHENKQTSDYFPLRCFLGAFFICSLASALCFLCL